MSGMCKRADGPEDQIEMKKFTRSLNHERDLGKGGGELIVEGFKRLKRKHKRSFRCCEIGDWMPHASGPFWLVSSS